jgi:hypothetical protein
MSSISDFISKYVLFRVVSNLNILRADETAISGIASEVANPFDTAIILAQRLVKFDSNPPSNWHLRNEAYVPV